MEIKEQDPRLLACLGNKVTIAEIFQEQCTSVKLTFLEHLQNTKKQCSSPRGTRGTGRPLIVG